MTRVARIVVAIGLLMMLVVTVDPAYEAVQHWVDAVLWGCLAFFIFEWIVRLQHAIRSGRALGYAVSFRGLVDAAAAIAVPLAIAFGTSPQSAWLLGVFWLLKLVPAIPGLRQLRRVLVVESGPLL